MQVKLSQLSYSRGVTPSFEIDEELTMALLARLVWLGNRQNISSAAAPRQRDDHRFRQHRRGRMEQRKALSQSGRSSQARFLQLFGYANARARSHTKPARDGDNDP